MAGREKRDPNKLTSLLLQPPNSGFSWNQMSGGSILMPVSQQNVGTEGNTESTVESGQSGDGNTNRPSAAVVSSMQEVVPTGPFSQLQQPLRPPAQTVPPQAQSQLQAPVTAATPYQQGGPPAYSQGVVPPPPSTCFVSQPHLPPQESIGNSVVGPPPTGPPRDFHRQSPFTHATMAGSVFAPSRASFGSPSPEQVQFGGMAQQQPPPLSPSGGSYVPVKPHWFYQKEIEKKGIWIPFSMLDSSNLEEALSRRQVAEDAVVTTDGGRYDVNVHSRLRHPVYWDEPPTVVRRCTWFYKVEGQNRFVPYEEDVAAMLEDHYQKAVATGVWHQRLELPGNQVVVMHNTSVMVHFLPSSHPDEWGNINEGQTRPRVVKRGVEEVETIEDGEPTQVDHLVFVVHGVGSVCDFKFRSVEECLDDIRNISLGLIKTHFAAPFHEGKIGRIEFLPVSWHSTLHGDATGIDSALKHITLNSISKLRHFTNDTLLDILFYTSPVYCQTILDTVGSEINRLYHKFMERNAGFSGTVALAGHSLGSLILYDILAHQTSPNAQDTVKDVPEATIASSQQATAQEVPQESESLEAATCESSPVSVESIFEELSLGDYLDKIREERVDLETLKLCTEVDLKEMGLPMGPRKKLLSYVKDLSEKQNLQAEEQKECNNSIQRAPTEDASPHPTICARDSVASVNYTVGFAGTGQLSVSYPRISFSPSCFFALGSPIAMFLVVRGNETLGEDFRLPTCPAFFNIFHPFDPVAYRIETLIDPNFSAPPVLIPHHKGRKRMHLELKESLSRMGSDIKQRLMDSLRYTWNSIHDFARAHRFSPSQVEAEMDLVVQEEIKRRAESTETESTVTAADLQAVDDLGVGQLNGGRRIDYVLQEKPIESFNEYLFALASHACYWESEDTVLLILKELYALQGVTPQVPGRSFSQPKVQLYNPAILGSAQPQQLGQNYLSSPSIDRSPPATSPVATLPTPTAVATAPSSRPPSVGPVAPPPLQGFVRTSPLVRK